MPNRELTGRIIGNCLRSINVGLQSDEDNRHRPDETQFLSRVHCGVWVCSLRYYVLRTWCSNFIGMHSPRLICILNGKFRSQRCICRLCRRTAKLGQYLALDQLPEELTSSQKDRQKLCLRNWIRMTLARHQQVRKNLWIGKYSRISQFRGA
eukprot:SAG31_NODE_4903_length_2876_cov_3.418437_1_plen_152_part_00